jgi:hypothetical protein
MRSPMEIIAGEHLAGAPSACATGALRCAGHYGHTHVQNTHLPRTHTCPGGRCQRVLGVGPWQTTGASNEALGVGSVARRRGTVQFTIGG